MEKQLENVRHDYIRYANCWEDADVLLDALELKTSDRVLSIGSAGDNTFSLLSKSPELVVAVDINAVQLELIRLKKAGFQTLDYSELKAFLGFKEANNRIELYEKVKEKLPVSSQKFWRNRMQEIEGGVIFQGKFERYFEKFRRKVLPKIHTRSRVKELFRDKTAEEQKTYHDTKWYNLRWRLLFRIFFSRFVMGRLGRDPEFLKQVKISVSKFILGQAKRHLRKKECQRNYFLQFIMNGKFDNDLPHYMRAENFDAILENIERLEIVEGLAEDAFKKYPSFTAFNLSNIFEYMNDEVFEQVTNQFVENGNSGARYAYWNLMVDRQLSKVNDLLVYETLKSEQLRDQDNGFFYLGVHLDRKK